MTEKNSIVYFLVTKWLNANIYRKYKIRQHDFYCHLMAITYKQISMSSIIINNGDNAKEWKLQCTSKV